MRWWILALVMACSSGGSPPKCARALVWPLLGSCPEPKPATPPPTYVGPPATSVAPSPTHAAATTTIATTASPTMTIGAWYRFTLASGEVLDAQLIGGDANAYFIQIPAGVFSVAHAQVRAAAALQ